MLANLIISRERLAETGHDCDEVASYTREILAALGLDDLATVTVGAVPSGGDTSLEGDWSPPGLALCALHAYSTAKHRTTIRGLQCSTH